MDFFITLAVSIVLLVTAAVMMRLHTRTWKSFRELELDEEEFDYRRRQHRRRMQTSAMLAVSAVALAVGHAATIWWIRSAWFVALFWLAVILLTCWLGLLALVDIWATKHHYGRRRHDCLIERTKLEAELRRIQAAEGNERRKNET